MPTIHNIKKHTGIAGQFSYSVELEYEGEDKSNVAFVSDVYGSPIVMVTAEGNQTFVTDPSRFGPELSESWVRNFFAGKPAVHSPARKLTDQLIARHPEQD